MRLFATSALWPGTKILNKHTLLVTKLNELALKMQRRISMKGIKKV